MKVISKERLKEVYREYQDMHCQKINSDNFYTTDELNNLSEIMFILQSLIEECEEAIPIDVPLDYKLKVTKREFSPENKGVINYEFEKLCKPASEEDMKIYKYISDNYFKSINEKE